MKVAFMFPGVGSHYAGMGEYFNDNFKIARETFQEASDTLGTDMVSLCMDKSRKLSLDALENAQTALVTVSMAAFRVFEQEIGIKPDAMLGYSLGEYSALCASGVMGFADVLKLVHSRGLIVSEYAASIDGTMAWVNNLEPETVEQICAEVKKAGEEVVVSAYDTPQKTSISGSNAGIRLAGEKVVERGGIPIPLRMSGPFHSPLMKPAADRYRELLIDSKIHSPNVPVIANRSALLYRDVEGVLDNLWLQLVEPVRWLDSLRYLLQEGMTIAVEMGPKDVLKYLLKAVDPNLLMVNYEKEKDVRRTEQALVVQETEYNQVITNCLAVVAGTRNYSTDLADYERRVVLPFRQVQHRYEELAASESSPKLSDVQRALQMMQGALTAKRIRGEERERHLQRVLNNKVLQMHG
ncbi:[acyl-carrier-protein] S-malonyltransferase [Marininema mesophilum]|uniref:[acyl-carrier-protein] S-malonyltransferase n=1 Tax=Marininema mesophilum TaxID=1048340 RepID=A0A1H2QC44_9BACL|nr:ACP S-malonyltransferase [Marininema mesophilum]SDW03989.1 [acyl-carrier-protein] S-malonyltransferase [Marininema mesophilum]